MDNTPEQLSLATALAEIMSAELEQISIDFNRKAQEIGEKYGVKLVTEVSFSIETKDDQEGR
jgi:hypothetical protein